MREIEHNISDGGKELSGIKDKNDCVVRAIAHATNTPYKLVHTYCAQYGRKSNRGMMTGFLNEKQILLGHKISPVKIIRYKLTVNKFMKGFITGTFLVCTVDHMFAVKDGILFDSGFMNNQKVREAFRLTKI